MMRQIRHPHVRRDLFGIVETTGGNIQAASRRLDEVDTLLEDIASNPLSGVRLSQPLGGWLVRHSGRGHRVTIVFKADPRREVPYIALVAFGGQDWMSEGAARRDFGG